MYWIRPSVALEGSEAQGEEIPSVKFYGTIKPYFYCFTVVHGGVVSDLCLIAISSHNITFQIRHC